MTAMAPTERSKEYFSYLVDQAANSGNLSQAIRAVFRDAPPPDVSEEQVILLKTLLLASLASADKRMRKNMREVLKQVQARRERAALDDFVAFLDNYCQTTEGKSDG